MAQSPSSRRNTDGSDSPKPARASQLAPKRDLDELREGGILVVAVLEPSWTPAMQRAAGIVAERGGILSHAAVVAREMGKPAVVGVAGATRRLRSGEKVRIDGTSGDVSIA